MTGIKPLLTCLFPPHLTLNLCKCALVELMVLAYSFELYHGS